MALEQTFPPIGPPPPPQPPHGRAPWGYADMAKAIAAVIVGAIVVTVPAAAIAFVIAGGPDVAEHRTALAVVLVANALAEVVLLLAVFVFAVRRYNLSWSALGLRLPDRAWWLPLPMLFGAWSIVLSYFAFIDALGIEPRGNLPSNAFDTVPLAVLTGIISLVLAPLMEETFFRGFLFGGLRGRWGLFLAAVGSGFLFALAHLDPLLYLPFTAVGVLFAWGYAYSGSLLTSIAAHLMFNAVSYGLAVSGAFD